MGGGYSLVLHNSHRLCRCFNCGLDLKIWGSGRHHDGPRSTIHLSSMECPLQTSWDLSRDYHCIPPSSKRVGGALSPPTEGRFQSKTGRQRVAFTLTLDPARPQIST